MPKAPDRLDTKARLVFGLSRAAAWSLALLAAAALTWVASGVPPAFLGLTVRLALGAWLVVGVFGIVVAVRTFRPQSDIAETDRRRWPVWTPPWLTAAAVTVVGLAMVPMSFVIDGAVPALVIGADPGRTVAQSVDLREAQGRSDVDRTRVRYETEDGVVDSWAADPDFQLGRGSSMVYDRSHPKRVMPTVTWEKERKTPMRMPLSLIALFAVAVAPFVTRLVRSQIYGGLQPGVHIVSAARVRRTTLVTLEWEDGSSATFVDVPGFAEAVERLVRESGGEDISLPWSERRT